MSEETVSPPQIKVTWLLGVALAFVLFVIIGAYSSRMTHTYLDYDQERANQRYETLKKLRTDEQALISKAEWIDQSKGIVRIPIEEAMAKEIEDLKAATPQVGCEIAGAVPTPAAISGSTPAPAPATTNAAPAVPAKPKAEPKKTDNQNKSALVNPDHAIQSVFKLRPIVTKIFVRNGAGTVLAIGTLISADIYKNPHQAQPSTSLPDKSTL